MGYNDGPFGRSPTSRRASPGPAATRRLAIALPAAAFAIGLGVERSRTCRAAVTAFAVLVAAGGVAVATAGRAAAVERRGSAGRIPPHPPHGAGVGGGSRIRRVIVLVPARDEAAVIGQVLGDLAVQDGLGSVDVEVVVIDDRSSDGTGTVAAAAIEQHGMAGRARVVRRVGGADGKGAALASVALCTAPDTGVVVLDADARISRSFISACVSALDAGTGIATARRRMLRPVAGNGLRRSLAEAQDDEQVADDVLQRARSRMHGASELRGDGMVVRAELLAALGGWGAGALCEDLDLSARAYLRYGIAVERVPGVDVWEQPVLSPIALVRQRVRWAEGLVRRDLAVVLPAQLDGSIPLRRRLDALGYALQALVPWLAAGLVLRATASGGERARNLAAALAIAYGAAGGAMARAAVRDPADARLVAVRRVVGVLALESLWVLALPVGWVRAARRPVDPTFARTRHLPTAAFAPAPVEPRTGNRD